MAAYMENRFWFFEIKSVNCLFDFGLSISFIRYVNFELSVFRNLWSFPNLLMYFRIHSLSIWYVMITPLTFLTSIDFIIDMYVFYMLVNFLSLFIMRAVHWLTCIFIVYLILQNYFCFDFSFSECLRRSYFLDFEIVMRRHFRNHASLYTPYRRIRNVP